MVEADRPGKLFIGGLNTETNEKTLESVFGKYGHIIEVLLMKDRDTNKSRGFAFITFENPADAKDAAKDMNGKSLDGKTIKVEQANKPSFESGGRRRLPLQRNRGTPRNLRCSRGGNGGARGRPSNGGNLGNVLKHKDATMGVKNKDGGYALNVHMSSSRAPFAAKRGPSSRSGGPPPKRSASSASGRSSSGMGERGAVSRERENYGAPSRREPVSSRRDVSVSPRDEGYATKYSYSSKAYPSSRDTKDYAVSLRDYSYRDYGHSSSRDEHSSRGYSDRDNYGGGRDRDYSEHASGGSYRDSYQSYGCSRGGPPARGVCGRSSRYDDYTSARDGYGGNRESYSSGRNDTCSSGRECGGSRQERGLPYSASRESYGSSGYATPRGHRGGSRCERGGHKRY